MERLISARTPWRRVRWRCPLCTRPTFGLTSTGPPGVVDRAIATAEDHYRHHHPDAPAEVTLTVSAPTPTEVPGG